MPHPPSTEPRPRVAALLAAGGGTRFVGPTHKLLAELDGQPVWARALDNVLAAGYDHVVVVTGAVPLDVPEGVTVRHNPAWAQGQASSLQAAIHAAAALGADMVTIGLADQPFVTSEAWRSVADADSDCPIVIAVYDGIPGPNPVRLRSDVWPLLPTDGDIGARELLRDHPDWVCKIDCVGSPSDIDTLEDLARWNT